jgi:hypothetical protein
MNHQVFAIFGSFGAVALAPFWGQKSPSVIK